MQTALTGGDILWSRRVRVPLTTKQIVIFFFLLFDETREGKCEVCSSWF